MVQPISTKVTDMFAISSPIISAPMAYATTPALVAAVINAGGLGFLGAGNDPAPKLVNAIKEARSKLSADKQHLVGMGFVGWVLDMFDKPGDERLKSVLDQNLAAVWLAFGKDLGKYVSRVREHNASHNHNTRVILNVNSVEELLHAAKEWHPDVIVIQGAEAGGRGGVHSPPTAVFLEQAVAAAPEGTIIAVAGGITTGSQVATMLTAGAAAVVIGTRLLFTPECMFTDEMKQILLKAGPGSTDRSTAYDIVFPPGVWQEGIQSRCVNNSVIEDFKSGLAPETRKANITSGKSDYLLVYAGVGISEINEIQDTDTVIKAIHNEAVTSLKGSGLVA